jgi:hypothetical protein
MFNFEWCCAKMAQSRTFSMAERVDWIPLNGEVRGVRVSGSIAQQLEEHEDRRPCGGLLDRYVACVQEYNIEVCDDEKFLYRKCIRAFLQQRYALCANSMPPRARAVGLRSRRRRGLTYDAQDECQRRARARRWR